MSSCLYPWPSENNRDNRDCKFQSLKFHDLCQKFYGRKGGQHDQHFVKNKFVKNGVGGREVNLNLDNVHKYIVVVFWGYPLCDFGISVTCQRLSDFLTLLSTGSARFLFHGGEVQSARSLIGLSRDLIGSFPGHHTPLYSVGVYYGASRKKYSKNLEIRSSFHNFCLMEKLKNLN